MGKSRKRKNEDKELEAVSAKTRREKVESPETKLQGSIVSSKKKKSKKKRKREKSQKVLTTVCEEAQCEVHLSGAEVKSMDIQMMTDQPRIHIDLEKLYGSHGARPGGNHLHCKDIKDLIMFTVLGSGRWEKPSWCDFSCWREIDHTLFALVGNVSGQNFLDFLESFKFVASNFEKGYAIKNDGTDGRLLSPLESFLFYKMKKKSAKKKAKSCESRILQPLELVLTKEQQFVNEFPFADNTPPDEKEAYVSTKRDSEYCRGTSRNADDEESMSGESQMFAIDCEMCLSSNGRELTRVSIVNENFEVVYDSYVKPAAVITDYLTQYSGITPDILSNVKTTLGDVQHKLVEIISKDDIIVGHSLENDMRALKIFHDNYIDTSIIYGDQRGTRFKPSLKKLVKQHLRREIQTGESGHCSIEDAKSCMELVRLKMEKGLQYGLFETSNESIFEAFSRADKTSAVVDAAYIARQHCFDLTKGVLCTSDEQAVKGTKESLNNSDFVFAHIRDFERLLKDNDAVGKTPSENQIKETFSKIDGNLREMIENTPKNTLVVVLFASGFLPSHIQRLRMDKDQRQNEEVTSALKKANPHKLDHSGPRGGN